MAMTKLRDSFSLPDKLPCLRRQGRPIYIYVQSMPILLVPPADRSQGHETSTCQRKCKCSELKSLHVRLYPLPWSQRQQLLDDPRHRGNVVRPTTFCHHRISRLECWSIRHACLDRVRSSQGRFAGEESLQLAEAVTLQPSRSPAMWCQYTTNPCCICSGTIGASEQLFPPLLHSIRVRAVGDAVFATGR